MNLLNDADKIIIECVDKALSYSRCDKVSFYSTLESKYGVKREEIADKFEKVHSALRDTFGTEHYAIDRLIVRTLHIGVKTGSYNQLDEIEAHAKVTEVFMAEAEMGITSSKARADLFMYAKQLVGEARQMKKLIAEDEKKLLEAERMAAIGQTAGMVGHDLRNPLQTIAGEIYLAKDELNGLPESAEKKSLRESMETIEQQVGYMDKIVSDLQTYVKPVDPHRRILNLKPLMFSILAQANIPSNIETNVQIEDSQEILADPELLKRVMINLVTNAVQAMPRGGDLTLSACATDQDIKIIVKDTGEGIPEDVKPKLFTPLFTTKARGQGFGLAVCKRVVEAHGGTITFESQKEKGTEFIVNLPNS